MNKKYWAVENVKVVKILLITIKVLFKITNLAAYSKNFHLFIKTCSNVNIDLCGVLKY